MFHSSSNFEVSCLKKSSSNFSQERKWLTTRDYLRIKHYEIVGLTYESPNNQSSLYFLPFLHDLFVLRPIVERAIEFWIDLELQNKEPAKEQDANKNEDFEHEISIISLNIHAIILEAQVRLKLKKVWWLEKLRSGKIVCSPLIFIL